MEREKSLPQLSRDGGISSVSQIHFIKFGLSMFQKKVSLTFMFFARIETRYVVLGLRPESERKSVGILDLQKIYVFLRTCDSVFEVLCFFKNL